MPELPEVETIILGLRPQLVGKKIVDTEILNDSTITNPKDREIFKGEILNKKINHVNRKGKYIDIRLDGKLHLIIHLRMTGQLIFSKTPINLSHLRVKFILDQGYIFFNDIRKFGTISLLTSDCLFLEKGYYNLGVDSLSDEFNLHYLKNVINKKSKRPVKNFILDQSIIAGLGNIYADESLFLAGIHPERMVSQLKEKELCMLVDSIKKILYQAIKNRGTTFSDYKDSYGKRGENQNFLKVYGRGGGECTNCQTILATQKIGGRTAVFCPNCQK